jgi:hypothetical protein
MSVVAFDASPTQVEEPRKGNVDVLISVLLPERILA